jgi:hypothetical protein
MASVSAISGSTMYPIARLKVSSASCC